MYRTLNEHYREKFGCKVYKLSLDGGFTCPNRDGTLGTGGCIFCAGDGSGAFAESCHETVEAQIQQAKARVSAKNRDGKYIAYFQSFTNTYAPTERLRQLYFAAIAPEDIVGLAIGTRPDCLPEDVIAPEELPADAENYAFVHKKTQRVLGVLQRRGEAAVWHVKEDGKTAAEELLPVLQTYEPQLQVQLVISEHA